MISIRMNELYELRFFVTAISCATFILIGKKYKEKIIAPESETHKLNKELISC